MKIKFTRHYVWVERTKSGAVIPKRTNNLWYRDMNNFKMWKYFLMWCFGPQERI